MGITHDVVVRIPVVVVVMVALLAVASAAHAQPSKVVSPEDKATAEALFREGQKLFDEGNAEAACPKFAASYALDGGLGTLINLARCYETVGRSASAWGLYTDLEARATRAGQPDRARIARERIDALEPTLCRVRVVLGDAAKLVADLAITRDGQPLASAALGVAVAVDPGTHDVQASAPGYLPWSTTIEVKTAGQTVDVTIGELALAPPEPVEPKPLPTPEPTPVQPQTPPDTPTPPLLWAGIATGGAAVVVLAIGAGFAGVAASTWSDADCMDGRCRDKADQLLAEDANAQADTATGLIIAGGVVGAAAVAMIVVALVTDTEEVSVEDARLTLRF